MNFQISCTNPLSHYLDIKTVVKSVDNRFIYLQLPAWRPGRYELANYARNLRGLKVNDPQGHTRTVTKLSKDRWKVATSGSSSLTIEYQYYAHQLDAGGSYVDDEQWYLNFINCLIYVEGRLNEPYTVTLDIPKAYKVASGLKTAGHGVLQAPSYYRLVDCPVMASRKLLHWEYPIKGIQFHLWFHGEHKLSKPRVLKAFKAFSLEQIKTMGEFPEKDYHFLFQVPVKRFYHGVEHSNSTVIVLGPSSELHKKRYVDFLGVSSHELFHAWNILKIKPKSLLPYDFSKEVYFEEGYVAEGFTTYYGDLFLIRSKVFDENQYYKELNTLFKRHFENEGRFHSALTESSWDLWLDGYKAGAPARKVSIYTKGALVALMLDLTLRRITHGKASLDNVIRKLWESFGKKNLGYTSKDVMKICQELTSESFKAFFDAYIYGTKPMGPSLNSALELVGCFLKRLPSKQSLKRGFGVRVSRVDGQVQIKQIVSGSAAKKLLSVGDVIVKVNGKAPPKNLNKALGKRITLKLAINRNGRKINLKLSKSKERFFDQFKIDKMDEASASQKSQYKKWLGTSF